MTIDELIERLEEYRDELGGDTEVRLMTQEHWPFENAVAGLASGDEFNPTENDSDGTILYIVEGQQLGYGSKHAWEIAS